MRANTISGWLARMSSICAGVMSRRSLPCTTHAFASLHVYTPYMTLSVLEATRQAYFRAIVCEKLLRGSVNFALL